MRTLLIVAVLLTLAVGLVDAQTQPPVGTTPVAPPPAKSDSAPVQTGSQPNPGEVRPGNEAGDSPSAAAGNLVRRESERRILGLPVTAALVIAGALVVLLVIAGLAVPGARRRHEARGGGTYGPRD